VKTALRIARSIDRVNEVVGLVVSWLALVMILIGAYNAIVRYLGRFLGSGLSSNVYIELQWYLFSLIFLFGAAYTLQRNSHVRVDVLYGRLGPRKQAWIDLLGSVFFLIPFCIFGLWVSWPAVANSWRILEVSSDPGGLPRYPIKTAILVGFVLLVLQGLSHAIHQIAFLRGSEQRQEEGGLRL
jgi:TRAP-type mannitol/chloroaromatic compound transport system permease small subunit